MKMEEKIHEKLESTFHPETLIIKNQSHLHAGHAGDDGSGESHFKVEISAECFGDISRVARERLVYQTLEAEMKIIHALSLKFL